MTMNGCATTSAMSNIFVAKRVRCFADAVAAKRRLVEDKRERFPPGADDMKRRCGGFDIGDARARRDQAQIGIANRLGGGGGDAARGVDDRQRYATAFQRLQPLLDLAAIVNRLDDRLGIAPTRLPVRKRALRIGLDQANRMAGFASPQGRGRWQAYLAAATLWVANTSVSIVSSFG